LLEFDRGDIICHLSCFVHGSHSSGIGASDSKA
jgi:hypothetical protein